MKKALALVLALVLALSMAVSAFALDVVTLKPAPESTATLIDISDDDYQLDQKTEYGTKYLVGPEGGVFYVTLDGSEELKNIEVTANGIVDAKLVDYDPEEYTGAETIYRVEKAGVAYEITTKAEKAIVAELAEEASLQVIPTGKYKLVEKDGTETVFDSASNKIIKNYIKANNGTAGINAHMGWAEDAKLVEIKKVDTDSYEYNKALAEELNDLYQSNKFDVDNYNKENVYVIELTVEENYSAAYKTGSVKVTADRFTGELDRRGNKVYEPVSGTMTIVSDVAIFEYEMVKWAAKKATNALLVNEDKGYSDYLTALDGYGKEYKEEDLREYVATVVSTTAFRAIEGKDLTVVANDLVEVTLKEIAAAQKGVNFANYIDGTYEDDNKNDKWDEGKEDVLSIDFGFYGDQVVKGEFEIAVNLGIDYYDLREVFGIKVEEDDIISYYVIDEDGNVVKTIKVDYMTDDIDEEVEFTIEGENAKLGQYSIVLEVPAAETEGEENPNTGAESVVGVVAALAVVSVATAAAVSLKK